MIALIAGNNDGGALELQDRLVHAGVDCSRASIVTVDTARTLVKAGKPVDLLFVLNGDGSQRLAEHVRALRAVKQSALVAVGHGGDAGEVLDLIRAGASDYLDTSGNLGEDVPSVIERLRTNQQELATAERGTATRTSMSTFRSE